MRRGEDEKKAEGKRQKGRMKRDEEQRGDWDAKEIDCLELYEKPGEIASLRSQNPYF